MFKLVRARFAERVRPMRPVRRWAVLGGVVGVASLAVLGASQAYWWNPRPWTPTEATPAFKTLKGTPVSPATAASYYGAGATSTAGLCRDLPSNADFCVSGVQPRAPELKELARALRGDPDLIYEYVRNAVETEFLFGSNKGGLGTSIDLSGTAFDQATLMVELLRESGILARYKFGDITLNGADFLAWTGVQKARAACEMLAAGGIPATVNGGGDCNLSGDVSSVVMSHVWVEADIAGQSYQFDPSYKPHLNKAGIDVRTAMGMSSGEAYSAALSGSSQSVDGKTVSGLNSAALAAKLQGYTNALRTRFKQADLNGAGIKDVVGGQEILPAVRPAGGWRQTSLAYVSTVRATWTGGVPDQYRTVVNISSGAPSGRGSISASLFSDEVYGRRLELDTFMWNPTNIVLFIDKRAAHQGAPYGTAPIPAEDADFTRTTVVGINHPFAASSGGYGDASMSRRLARTHASIVVGFGMASGRLSTAMSGTPAGEMTEQGYNYRVGEKGRALQAADWLAQFSRSLDLHGRLAGARPTHIHSFGMVIPVANQSDGGSFVDRTDVLDVETAIGLSSLENDAASRRAAIHAIAATAATLEGSVVEQRTDSPDSVSTARRFAFANSIQNFGSYYQEPDEGYTGQSNLFYRVNWTDSVPAQSAFSYATWAGWWGEDPRPVLLSALTGYHNNGFDVVVAGGALLGPGALEGSYTFLPGTGVRMPSTQRGGAFVAVKYDGGGDPSEIAHVPTSYLAVTKGGGGNTAETGVKSDLLKDRFNDRSAALGVDLKSGKAGYTSPVIRSVGQGEFPHRLDETLAARGGGLERYDPEPQPNPNPKVRINGGLVSNFDGDAGFSGSGMDGMGGSRLEVAAPTIAAFAALQDLYREAPAPRREVAGLLTADWWGRTLVRNVLTINQGGGSERYVEAGVEGSARLYLPAGGGSGKALVTGEAIVMRPQVGMTDEWVDLGSATFRLKLDDQIGIQVLDGQGGTRTYEYWRYGKHTGTNVASYEVGFAQGFRLKTWSFANGVALTVNYPAGAAVSTTIPTTTASAPISVTSNLGYTLALSAAPAASWVSTLASCASLSAAGDYTSPSGPPQPILQSFTDAAGQTYRVKFEQADPRTTSRRPVETCQLSAAYAPTDPTAPSVRYTYDTLGRVKEARDAVAIREASLRGAHQFFIAEGYRGERQDPTGGRYAVEWLQGGSLTRHIDEMGRVTTSEYDGRGRVKARVFPWEERQQFVYDDRDNVLEMRRISKTPDLWWGQTIVIKAEYHPAWNKPTKITLPATVWDPNERVYDYSYNGQGLLTEVKEPQVYDGVNNVNARPTTTTTYDGFGRVLTVTDPTGRRTTNGYGEYSQPGFCLTSTTTASQVGGLNLLTKFACNGVGDVTSVTDPRNNVSTISYDAMRRKTETLGPAGTNIRTQWVYNASGQLTDEKKWDATAGLWRTTTTTYSATGMPLAVTDASGEVARICYDAMDRERVKIDRDGRAARTTYNAAGDPTLIERWFRAGVSDPACALTAELPAGQTTHTWRSYSYLANGLLAYEADARSYVTAFGYDGLGRKLATYFPDPDGSGPLASPIEHTLYDERGNIQYIAHRSHSGDNRWTLVFSDAVGRVAETWERDDPADPWPKGRSTRTSYDLAGRVVYREVYQQTAGGSLNPAQKTNVRAYGYDAAGRLTHDVFVPEHGTNPSLSFQYVYGYDAAGNRTSIQWPGAWTASYTFDAENRMATVSFTGGSGTWTYDSQSRPTNFARSNGTSTSYGYSADSDLTNLTQTFASGSPASVPLTYTRDRAGLIVYRSNPAAYDWAPTLGYGRTYGAANALNQVASEAGVGLAFDGRGNMTTDGTWTFAYDMRNRMLSASKPGTTATYDYDGDDRRTKKTVNGVITRMLWSGDDELAEADAAGNIVRRFVPGASVDTPLAMIDAAGTVTWIHADGQGSIINTSNSAGAAGTPVTYSPYGEMGGSLPAGVPFGYTGRYHDAETGLWYYRARYYHPRLGQFLQTDPIGTKDDPNLYFYVGGDPVNKTDPTGECAAPGVAQLCGGLIGAAMGGGVEVLRQVVLERKSLRTVDYSKVGKEAFIGGVAGATGVGAARVLTKAGTVGAAVIAGAVTGGSNSVMHGDSPAGVAVNTVAGAAGGRLSSSVTSTVAKDLKKLAPRVPGNPLQVGGDRVVATQAGAAAGAAVKAPVTATTRAVCKAYEKCRD